ncbi:hypothetical protein SO802_020020 [Lithocarpus litseifolius]|uniref:60S ribosomal protein L7a n=1 Tax=Lithocarpus litseifolius TaxID=425828 RepID=A0AAW2CAR9_9ROSI
MGLGNLICDGRFFENDLCLWLKENLHPSQNAEENSIPWNVLFAFRIQGLWNHRNRRIFKQSEPNPRFAVEVNNVALNYFYVAGKSKVKTNLSPIMGPKRGGKVAAAPAKKKTEKVLNPLFEKRPKQFAANLFKLLLKYRPEDKSAKKECLLKRAQAEAEGKTVEAKEPIIVKYGLNHVTYPIKQNKAQLVVIAHDVDQIELVVWLPALCRKMEIPYCIVKGKARLGSIVHKKTASVLCLTTVKNEDKLEFSKILEAIKVDSNCKYDEYQKKWGSGIMGSKPQAKTRTLLSPSDIAIAVTSHD